MAKAEFYSAAYMIIENKLWEVLFMRRSNTGYRDWGFQLPAGHLEWEESMIECAIRESKEELGIDIDISLNHARHTFTTVMMNKGVSNPSLQKQLGHAVATTTSNYIGSFEDENLKRFSDMLWYFLGTC